MHRVVLIDPRHDRRAVMRLFLGQCTNVVTVGDAASLSAAETEIREGFADVVVLEIQMPVPEGLATIEALHQHFPNLHIVVCTFHDDAGTKAAATAAGADGYVMKPFSARDLEQFFDRLPLLIGEPAFAPVDAAAPPA